MPDRWRKIELALMREAEARAEMIKNAAIRSLITPTTRLAAAEFRGR
jgi:hypothetical protein